MHGIISLYALHKVKKKEKFDGILEYTCMYIDFFRFKVPVVGNWKGVCLQKASKPHSYHLKIW